MTTYAICATPRSGSSLLCDLLWRCRSMGKPREYFNPRGYMLRFAEDNGLMCEANVVDFPRYLETVLGEFSTPNGVFGTKLFPMQLQKLMSFAAGRGFLRTCTFFLMSRRDVVAQAVSWHIA